jgi:hypothetical protein
VGAARPAVRPGRLIKVNALQVAPAELEALLLTRPDVADAAVVGRPDPRTGEVPVAVVVPRGELDPDALRSWVAARVAPHKRLADVVLTDRIPRTPSGKIPAPPAQVRRTGPGAVSEPGAGRPNSRRRSASSSGVGSRLSAAIRRANLPVR